MWSLFHIFLWLHRLVLWWLRIEVERLRELLLGSEGVQGRLHWLLAEVLGLLRRLVVEVRVVLVGIGCSRLPLSELRRVNALVLTSLEALVLLELIVQGLLSQDSVRHLISVAGPFLTFLEVLRHIVVDLEHGFFVSIAKSCRPLA